MCVCVCVCVCLTVFLGVGGQNGGSLVTGGGWGLQTTVKICTFVAPAHVCVVCVCGVCVCGVCVCVLGVWFIEQQLWRGLDSLICKKTEIC